MPSAPATMTVGMIARPSRPSVRFTALLEPTITKYASRMYIGPRSIMMFLNTGTMSAVSAELLAV